MFDFNGTLSDDEPLLFAILSDLFAEQGRPLAEDVYYDRFAGLSDPEIVHTWLGADHPAVDAVLDQVRRGPRFARVDSIETREEAPRGEPFEEMKAVPSR